MDQNLAASAISEGLEHYLKAFVGACPSHPRPSNSIEERMLAEPDRQIVLRFAETTSATEAMQNMDR